MGCDSDQRIDRPTQSRVKVNITERISRPAWAETTMGSTMPTVQPVWETRVIAPSTSPCGAV